MSSITIYNNQVIESSHHDKPLVFDYVYHAGNAPKPVVIFSHGFKGFKDWGCFPLIGEHLANAGFFFVKFNFSHNGTTLQQPTDFADLEAFGHNNFSIELNDLGDMIDKVESDAAEIPEIDTSRIYLMGHSRGGAISILKAREDKRVQKLVTWSAVAEFGRFWSQDVLDDWKRDGVMYIYNGRTGQQMPMYYSSYEDFYAKKERLDVPAAAKALNKPWLIVHGTNDSTVNVDAAKRLHQWAPQSELMLLDDAGHTLGAKHPWDDRQLPGDTEKALERTIHFLQ